MDVKCYKLSNGLSVWLNEDHTQPTILGTVVVKAGAKDSPNSGIAHYFEHIMFKGTNKIGTTDYRAEKQLLNQIEEQYSRLANTADEQRRAEIQKDINQLSIAAAKYVVPNEFNNLISQYGGTGLNAATGWDHTFYHNTFSPKYIEQWCELNSERMLNPVFRMFQNELETVYEEKNMYADSIHGMAIEQLFQRFFAPHPYQYSIIGSTKNLKSPDLKAMKKFYEKYYVAGNMGLMLVGDFETEKILPIIEKYFGRLRAGEVERPQWPLPTPLNGIEKFKLKIKIPLVKGCGAIWRIVPALHKDCSALTMITELLFNDNNSGLLDSLIIDRKLMHAMASMFTMKDAGAFAIVGIPKLPLQTNKSAMKLLLDAIEKLKSGDFSSSLFESCRLSLKKTFLQNLENKQDRMNMMVDAFVMEKEWEDKLNVLKDIEQLTKKDVVAIANKYFTDDYLFVKKTLGKYEKDRVTKPPFAPIVPPSNNTESEYAKELKLMPTTTITPRFVDFEKDMTSAPLTENKLGTLYYSKNPINELFTLKIVFQVGEFEIEDADKVKTYLDYLGTDSLTVKELNSALQELGANVTFHCTQSTFYIKITGLDENLAESVKLINSFMQSVKPDKSKLKALLEEKKISDNAIRKSPNDMAYAAFKYMVIGSQSPYLKDLTYKELKAKSADDLIDSFRKIMTYECDVHYCGKVDFEKVLEIVKRELNLHSVTTPTINPIYVEQIERQKPQIFFLHCDDTAQSIIYGAMKLKPIEKEKRVLLKIFDRYFGNGMSSVMFQEIREFRSMAYRTSSWAELPPIGMWEKHSDFFTMLSTQTDKTNDALELLNSLLGSLTISETRLENSKKAMISALYSHYPIFRNITSYIANKKREGFQTNNIEEEIEKVRKIEVEDLEKFYNENIKDGVKSYLVVGNKKLIDMDRLAKLGEVTHLKEKDILR